MDRLNFNLTEFRNVSAAYFLLDSDDFSGTPKALIAAKTGSTIYVCRITFCPTTDAAETLTFQDTSGTPVPVYATTTSPGVGGVLQVDFGPEGMPLTPDKGLNLVNSGAGLAGAIQVTAYQRLTPSTAITPNQPGSHGGV